MTAADVPFTASSTVAGSWAGSTLGGLAGAVIGGIVGLGMGVIVAVAGVRISFAAPVLGGAIAGGILGRGIAHALCLPGSCRGAETAAALLTGFGALVGVGLVVALVTRSFEEYRQSRARGPK